MSADALRPTPGGLTAADGVPRRSFLVGCVSLGAALVGFIAGTFRFLVPNVLYSRRGASTSDRPHSSHPSR